MEQTQVDANAVTRILSAKIAELELTLAVTTVQLQDAQRRIEDLSRIPADSD